MYIPQRCLMAACVIKIGNARVYTLYLQNNLVRVYTMYVVAVVFLDDYYYNIVLYTVYAIYSIIVEYIC
jgi:hypothetical protein